MAKRTALVTGVTGQDGAYLSRFLIEKGYHVVGTYRRSSTPNVWRLEAVGLTAESDDLDLVSIDITDLGSVIRLLEKYDVSEIYNLAAQSYVGASFDQPVTTAQITGLGCLNLLEAIRSVDKSIKFYQASTSEMFGRVTEIPQNEETSFYPRSPYGVAKLFAHWMTINYRESYDIFGCSGILFNHESPLRGEDFVTRKITKAVAEIVSGKRSHLSLGNVNAERDWGYARDFVEGMWMMLQHDDPGTYVLATGRKASVRDFVDLSFAQVGIDIHWEGEGIETRAITGDGDRVVKIDPSFYRPAEVDLLLGDASKAKSELGWQPKTSLEELCQLMVEADLKLYQG